MDDLNIKKRKKAGKMKKGKGGTTVEGTTEKGTTEKGEKEGNKFSGFLNNLYTSLNVSSILDEWQPIFEQIMNEPIVKSFKLNYIYLIVQFISVLAITIASDTDIIWGLITIVQISFLGYLVHYVSHNINFLETYEKYKDNIIITQNKYVDYLIRMYCKAIDFHDITHHDTEINKTPENVIIEFVMNFVTQAGWFLVVMFVIKNLNYYVVFSWGILYSSFHMINYSYIRSQTHMNHHADKFTNYGIDFWDIIFRTKYNNDYEEIENINHYSINIIILTTIMVFFIKNGASFFRKWF